LPAGLPYSLPYGTRVLAPVRLLRLRRKRSAESCALSAGDQCKSDGHARRLPERASLRSPVRRLSLPSDGRGNEPLAGSRVGLRADEQPADSGRASATESRPVHAPSFDACVQPPRGQSDDGHVDAFVVRIPSITAPRGIAPSSSTRRREGSLCGSEDLSNHRRSVSGLRAATACSGESAPRHRPCD
jgi:hypothetical protein